MGGRTSHTRFSASNTRSGKRVRKLWDKLRVRSLSKLRNSEGKKKVSCFLDMSIVFLLESESIVFDSMVLLEEIVNYWEGRKNKTKQKQNKNKTLNYERSKRREEEMITYSFV